MVVLTPWGSRVLVVRNGTDGGSGAGNSHDASDPTYHCFEGDPAAGRDYAYATTTDLITVL